MKSLVKIISIVGLSAFILTGCLGGDDGAEEAVKAAMQNASNIKSATFIYDVSSVMEGGMMAGGTVDILLTAAYDVNDLSSPKLDASLSLTQIMEGMIPESLKADVRFADSVLYFSAHELPSTLTLFVPDIDTYAGKWFKMDVPTEAIEEVMNSDFGSMLSGGTESPEEMSEFEKFMHEMEYLTDFKTGGKDGDLMKYSAKFNGEGVADIFLKMVESSGQTPDDEEFETFKEMLGEVDTMFYLWVDPEANLVTKIEGDLEFPIDPADIEAGMVVMSFSFGIENVGEDIKVEVPEEVEEFDASGLMGLFGGGMMAPAGDYEYEFDEDFEAEGIEYETVGDKIPIE